MSSIILLSTIISFISGCKFDSNSEIDNLQGKVFINKVSGDSCICPNGNRPDFTYNNDGRSIILCGNIEEQLDENSYLASEFLLINCLNGENIIDNSNDGVSKYIIKSFQDSLIVSETHYVLDPTKWNYDIREFVSVAYRFEGNALKKGQENFTFSPPDLNIRQINYIDSITNLIDKKRTTPKSIYPSDEKTIYMLFMGAINGNKKSEYLLTNLDSLYILDGAAAETYSEIAFDYIKKNLNSKEAKK